MTAPCRIIDFTAAMERRRRSTRSPGKSFLMAVAIAHTVPLNDERRVICHLSLVGFSADEILDNMDDAIDRAHVIQVRDGALAALAWAFTFTMLLTSLCVATLFPTDAMAATVVAQSLDTLSRAWSVVGAVLGWPLIIGVLIGVAMMLRWLSFIARVWADE